MFVFVELNFEQFFTVIGQLKSKREIKLQTNWEILFRVRGDATTLRSEENFFTIQLVLLFMILLSLILHSLSEGFFSSSQWNMKQDTKFSPIR